MRPLTQFLYRVQKEYQSRGTIRAIRCAAEKKCSFRACGIRKYVCENGKSAKQLQEKKKQLTIQHCSRLSVFIQPWHFGFVHVCVSVCVHF